MEAEMQLTKEERSQYILWLMWLSGFLQGTGIKEDHPVIKMLERFKDVLIGTGVMQPKEEKK